METMTDEGCVALVRRIRDEINEELRGKTDAELLAYYQLAGQNLGMRGGARPPDPPVRATSPARP